MIYFNLFSTYWDDTLYQSIRFFIRNVIRKGWGTEDRVQRTERIKHKKLLFMRRNMSETELCVKKEARAPYCVGQLGFDL